MKYKINVTKYLSQLKTNGSDMVLRIVSKLMLNAPQKEDGFSKLVGQFGRWQLMVFASVFLVKLSSGWVQMAILFLTPNTIFWCTEFTQNSTTVAKNSTCYYDCVKYSYDTSPFENTIVSEWGLVCERAWLASFTQMMLQLGVLIGSIVFGFLSDRYGRRYTFLFSITTVIVFGLAIPFSPNYAVFTILRFFLGAATSGTMVTSFVIIMEVIGPDYREILGCLYQIPFIIGHMTLPVFAYYYRRWDSYSLALAVPPIIYLGYFFVVSESPRWLISVGRVEDATKIVVKAAKMNKLPTSKIEENLKKLSLEITDRSVEPPHYGTLLSSSLRLHTICSCVMWLICGLSFFGFNQYISQTSPDPFTSVAAAGAIQIPANVVSIWLIRQFGRRLTTAAFFCLSGLCIVALGCVPNIFWLTITLGSLGVSCTAVVAASIYIYSSELFPTVVRNMGMGASSMSMRIGSMLAPFIANLNSNIPWLPTVIFGLAPIATGIVVLFLPETKGKTLPDTIKEIKTSG